MTSGARRLNLIDWLRSPSFAKCDADHRADLIAEYLNGTDRSSLNGEVLSRLGAARFGINASQLTTVQKIDLMRDAAHSVKISTYTDDLMRRMLAMDLLATTLEILVDPLQYGADDRNEAALIASRMPIIIAQTYAEL